MNISSCFYLLYEYIFIYLQQKTKTNKYKDHESNI